MAWLMSGLDSSNCLGPFCHVGCRRARLSIGGVGIVSVVPNGAFLREVRCLSFLVNFFGERRVNARPVMTSVNGVPFNAYLIDGLGPSKFRRFGVLLVNR